MSLGGAGSPHAGPVPLPDGAPAGAEGAGRGGAGPDAGPHLLSHTPFGFSLSVCVLISHWCRY